MNKVGIKLWNDSYLPRKKHTDDACYDCYVRLCGVTEIEISSRTGGKYVKNKESHETSFTLKPGERAKIPLGFALAMPVWLEAQIRPRSGLSSELKDSHFGTIDSNYRGEVRAIFENATSEEIKIEDQMRLAQMAIREIPSSKKTLERLEKLNQWALEESTDVQELARDVYECFKELLDNEIEFEVKDELDETERGANGFGSSGV